MPDRLGVFGYFASPEIAAENPSAPGNGALHGILDQRAALLWVHEHIAAFGGDPANIMMMGESAGASSVSAFLALRDTQQFFARTIVQSGSMVSPWDFPGAWDGPGALQKAEGLMNYTKARTLKALRALPTAELYAIGAAQGYNPAPDGHWLPSCPKDAPVLARRKQVMIGSNSMDTTAAPPWEPPSYYASSVVFDNTTIYAEYLAALVRANPLGFL